MKANRNIITNKKGQANIIILAIFTVIMGFGMLTIGTYLYYAVATAADSGTRVVNPGVAAVGTFTTTGNVSCGEWVNVTNASGGVARFYFNITDLAGNGGWGCAAQPAGIQIVGILEGTNTSVNAANQLFQVMNLNTTVNATMIATNPSDNHTVLTYRTVGVAGNTVTTTETLAQANWSSATLLGGVDPLTGQAAQNSLNNYVSVTFPLFGLALMILGFGVIYITLRKSFNVER